MSDSAPLTGEATRSYYFGTRGRPGHYLHDEQRHHIGDNHKFGDDFRWDWDLPWHRIDGRLNPSERQGECRLHHKDGWTALAFANRTDDRRPGSNSVFFFEGTLTFDEAVAEARKRWPDVMDKLAFDLDLHPAYR